MTARPLPSSPEMERAVLGGVLLTPAAVPTLDLEPEDFHVHQNGLIWGAVQAVAADGVGLDLRTLQAKLEDYGAFEDVGGMSYLAGLDLDLPDLSGLPTYADHLRKLRQRRELANAMIRAVESLCGGSEDAEEHVEAVRGSLATFGSGRVKPVCVANVEAEEVSFLWDPWIPRRKLTLLEGDPGQGKSYVSAALATSGSLGKGLPGANPMEPFKTLFFSAEDGIGDTLRPRLDSMGADCSLIWAHDQAIDLSKPEGFSDFRGAVESLRPSLVVIDPLVAFVGQTNTFRANEVRAILAPLAELAASLDCSILSIRHLTKGQMDRALYRGQGSIDFTAAARSVILAGTNASDPNERAIVHIKSNLAKTAGSLGYQIDEAGRFLWSGASTLTANDLLGAARDDEDKSAYSEAEDFLRQVLVDGPVPAKDVKAQAREVGVSVKSLKVAKQRLGIRSQKDGFEAGWHWLPPAEQFPPAESQTSDSPPEGDRRGSKGSVSRIRTPSTLFGTPSQDREGDPIGTPSEQFPPEESTPSEGVLGSPSEDCQPCQPQECPEMDTQTPDAPADVPPDDLRILTPDQLAAAVEIPAADLHGLFSALDGEDRQTFHTLTAELARSGLTPTTAGRLALAQLAAGNGDGKGGAGSDGF